MEKFPMCRICLVKNVPMYALVNKDLHGLYEKLTDIPFVTEDSRPILVCFFCCSKLKQCFQLLKKCLEAEELFAQMMDENYKLKPLINDGHLQSFSGFIKTPIEVISIVDKSQKETTAIKEELSAECKDVVEHKEENQSDGLEPENLNNSRLDEEYILPHHSELHSEGEAPLMGFKIEVEEELEVSRSKRRAVETSNLEPENNNSHLNVEDIPPSHSESDSEGDVPLMTIKTEVKEELLEVSKNKRRAVETFKPTPREICEELDLKIICHGTTESTDLYEKNIFTNENLIEKPDSPLPPSADFLAEEVSYINKVSEETTTVENLYRFSNISSDSDSFSDCCTVQEVSVIVLNYKEDEPQMLHLRQNPISESSVLKQNNLPGDGIENLTPVPSPLVYFSPIYFNDEIDNLTEINSDYTNTPLSSPASVKRNSHKKKAKGRLRERYQNMWSNHTVEKRKFNLNRGLEYMSRTGKVHQKKEIKSACKCPKKCSEKIAETARRTIFRNFWELGDHTRQWDFIAKYVSKLDKKRVVTENSQRNCTLRYSLPVTGDSGSIEKACVCKIMFLNTLSISYNFVKTALDKFEKGFGVIEQDCRGKHSNHPVSISRTAIESVCSM